jgi:hypothetical protein
MDIPSFDMWVLTNEGFKADINDDKKNRTDDEHSDEIQIEAPNEGNDITYIVSGNDVKIKEDSKTKDGNGTTIDTDVTTKEVNDKILKKDVKIAVEAINDIKECKFEPSFDENACKYCPYCDFCNLNII